MVDTGRGWPGRKKSLAVIAFNWSNGAKLITLDNSRHNVHMERLALFYKKIGKK